MADPGNWILKSAEPKEIEIDEITLHFFARDGKAIAKYTSPDRNCEVEVLDRAHAIGLTEKAVANANETGLCFRLEHGEMDESDPFSVRLTAACLSQEAYEALKAIEDTAEHNTRNTGLFAPTY